MKHVLYLALAITLSACVRIPPAPPMANEVEYYKQMYGQAAASASASNALTWSALGLVATVFGIILAVQYFFNIRLNTTRLEAITKEMQNQLEAQQNKLDAHKNTIDNLLTNNQQVYNYKIDLLAKKFEDYRALDKAQYTFNLKQYESALFDFLKIANTRITDSEFDSEVAYQIGLYIINVPYLAEEQALKLSKMLSIMKAKNHPAAHQLEIELNGKNVFLSNGGGNVKYGNFKATL